jgi:hypothetical protein
MDIGSCTVGAAHALLVLVPIKSLEKKVKLKLIRSGWEDTSGLSVLSVECDCTYVTAHVTASVCEE